MDQIVVNFYRRPVDTVEIRIDAENGENPEKNDSVICLVCT